MSIARVKPVEVIDFWFEESNRPLWFKKSYSFDELIKEKFGAVHKLASRDMCDDWSIDAEGSLGLILVLDQFSRNLYRVSNKAFSNDAKALQLAEDSLSKGFDIEIVEERRGFMYMPFMHSENIAHQDLSVKLFSGLSSEEWVKYAIMHKEIIERFGHFPHRNSALGRTSTVEEARFLRLPNSGF